MMLPNLGGDTAEYAVAWGLDGFVLTGGNDIGSSPQRDRSEEALLRLALEQGFPVLGVCRGLQFIQSYFGGRLRDCARENHVAQRHSIVGVPGTRLLEGRHLVNSFHGQAVAGAELAAPLQAFALSEEGWVEGLFHPAAPIIGVQWHPERESDVQPLDLWLVRQLFLGKE